MDDVTRADRLFACLLKHKEEAERDGFDVDESCARVIVQRLRTRALGLLTRVSVSFCVSVCVSVCLSLCCHSPVSLLWPPCIADVDIIFLSCGFFRLSSSFLGDRL